MCAGLVSIVAYPKLWRIYDVLNVWKWRLPVDDGFHGIDH